MHADRNDSVADLGTRQAPRLILSQFPNPDFARSCEKRNIRTLVFADDIVEAVRHVRQAHRISTSQALRPVCAGLVLARPFAAAAQGLVIRRDMAGTAPEILAVLLGHFGLNLSREQAREICRQIGADHPSLREALHRLVPAESVLDEGDAALVAQVLGGLQDLQHGSPGAVSWPRQCFLMGDRPDTMPPVALAVTGRARIIYYGPYYHLPRGSWAARMSVGFSQDIRGMPFSIEVHSTELLGKARILAERGGIFSLEFDIVVAVPHEPIEVRVMNEQGAIEGHMGLVGIDFTQWRPHPADAAQA
ncbi:hypothetical protein ASE63_16205 [Bosea sp. Root381]|nr:hypothetical protein ASE63_16205 [Bosea sp. Root381]